MKYGIILHCNIPKELKEIHNIYKDKLIFPPHITVCYLENIQLIDIISNLQNTKKFSVRFNELNNKYKYTYYTPNNLKSIHNIIKKFITNIYALPKKGFHMSLMYKVNKEHLKILNKNLPLSISVNKIFIMKELNAEWKNVKTIFLK